MIHCFLHSLISQIGKKARTGFQSFFPKFIQWQSVFLIICTFSFYNLNVVQAKVRKVKIDKKIIEALNISMKSIDSIELVLKKFFKTPEDYREIDKDLALLVKSGITKMNLRFEARGKEIVLKSKKKVMFKFSPLTMGDKVEDFAFNVNGQKFFIDPNFSYSYHKRRIGNIFGFSKQSLLEYLVIREVHAALPLVAVIPVLASIGTWVWRGVSVVGKVAGAKISKHANLAWWTVSTAATADFIVNDVIEPGVKAVTRDDNGSDKPSDCSTENKRKFYDTCKDEWKIFDLEIGQEKNCTQNKSYCGLNLNDTHFKNPGGTDSRKEKCVRKYLWGIYIPGYNPGDCASGSRKEEKCLTEVEEKVIDICSRAGYARLYTDNHLLFLQDRLLVLIDKSVYQYGSFYHFDDETCINFAEGDVRNDDKSGWGMKKEWAEKYCKAAGDFHGNCADAAKKCSSEITDLPQIDSSQRSTGAESVQ